MGIEPDYCPNAPEYAQCEGKRVKNAPYAWSAVVRLLTAGRAPVLYIQYTDG